MTLGVLLIIFGVVVAVGGIMMAFAYDNPGWLFAFALGVVTFFVGMGVTSYQSDKNNCLNTINVISQRETKWLDGECYMKANDGKFVPQTWIEKGYNDK